MARLPEYLHGAYEWIDSAGEWSEALSDPNYAREALANYESEGVQDGTVTHGALEEVIEWYRAHKAVTDARPCKTHETEQTTMDLKTYLAKSDSDLGPDADAFDVQAYNATLARAWKAETPRSDESARELCDAVLAGKHGDWVADAAKARR